MLFKPIQSDLLKDTLLKAYKKTQLENEIKKERQYYKALTDSTLFSKANLAGDIIDVNDNLLRVSGYTKEELLGKPHSIFRHPDMPSSTFAKMWDTIKKGQVWRGVVKSLSKDKKTYIVDATLVPLVDENGKIYEYISIRQDITEQEKLRLKVEEEQEKLRVHLTEQAVDHAREQFLLVFTHELKTPLNAIINFCEYVKKSIAKSDIENREKLLDLIRSNQYCLAFRHIDGSRAIPFYYLAS